MIRITDKHKCCGCSACAQTCPHTCISMKKDEEGFLYPYVDEADCVDCGLCETVCPELNVQSAGVVPVSVRAARNYDEEVRMSSSSGGVFSLLAEYVMSRHGGVVFGAKAAGDFSVYHTYAEFVEDLEDFRGSKYVQSSIGRSYAEAESFLKYGREVMFCGTPCQIAGLKKFLGREYENLLCVEIVCRGVPSHKVLMQYLSENFPDARLSEVDFRNKRFGWKKYSMVVKGFVGGELKINEKIPFTENPFMTGFLKNIYMRPSCYECPFKAFASGADVTLGDCWGADKFCPGMDDDRGVSLVIVHSRRAEDVVNALISSGLMGAVPVDLKEAVKYNPSIMTACVEPVRKHKAFFADDGRGFNEKIAYLCKESFSEKLGGWIYEIKKLLKLAK